MPGIAVIPGKRQRDAGREHHFAPVRLGRQPQVGGLTRICLGQSLRFWDFGRMRITPRAIVARGNTRVVVRTPPCGTPSRVTPMSKLILLHSKQILFHWSPTLFFLPFYRALPTWRDRKTHKLFWTSLCSVEELLAILEEERGSLQTTLSFLNIKKQKTKNKCRDRWTAAPAMPQITESTHPRHLPAS